MGALTTRGAARSVGTVTGRRVQEFCMGKVGSWKLQERLAWARFCRHSSLSAIAYKTYSPEQVPISV